MVSQVPYISVKSGRVYDITTYGITVITHSEKDGEAVSVENKRFIALVHVDGSERYRSGKYETEEDAHQDALEWSKAQEKKEK